MGGGRERRKTVCLSVSLGEHLQWSIIPHGSFHLLRTISRWDSRESLLHGWLGCQLKLMQLGRMRTRRIYHTQIVFAVNIHRIGWLNMMLRAEFEQVNGACCCCRSGVDWGWQVDHYSEYAFDFHKARPTFATGKSNQVTDMEAACVLVVVTNYLGVFGYENRKSKNKLFASNFQMLPLSSQSSLSSSKIYCSS